MTIDRELFKAGMRQLASGVTIIATQHDGERRGLTATAVCSVSTDPPTLLCCVNRQSKPHDLIEAAGCFSINVLAVEDAALANRFSGGETGEARFEVGSWGTLVTGAPILETALASFDCAVTETLDGITHTVFIGRVRAVATRPGRPALLYAEGDYAGLARLNTETG
ncbi:MAG TPA: flavin reductase family protein [Stellaceae bacterium]|nr:flavin reductase family protein [Stellaceae bacterium]